ncbi:hypothetical protein [Providencia alcalifaciens]|uniref:hypothetical protein n=1 Tax=Providencia alcalifaciens TaxID=126385 RepID=UPI001E65AFEA|nr:hypothetical protein [Providencia alcalifaciens]WGZ54382.1 hypothetical protein PO864_19565 [Providencia alcalifaciens]
MSDKYDWLSLTNSGMDVTFNIENIPIRFFLMTLSPPKKQGYFRRNQVDQLWEPEQSVPIVHRFVIEKPEFEGEGAKAHFLDYNALGEQVSKWTYGEARVPVLPSTDNTPPTTVTIELDPISVSLPNAPKNR